MKTLMIMLGLLLIIIPITASALIVAGELFPPIRSTSYSYEALKADSLGVPGAEVIFITWNNRAGIVRGGGLPELVLLTRERFHNALLGAKGIMIRGVPVMAQDSENGFSAKELDELWYNDIPKEAKVSNMARRAWVTTFSLLAIFFGLFYVDSFKFSRFWYGLPFMQLLLVVAMIIAMVNTPLLHEILDHYLTPANVVLSILLLMGIVIPMVLFLVVLNSRRNARKKIIFAYEKLRYDLEMFLNKPGNKERFPTGTWAGDKWKGLEQRFIALYRSMVEPIASGDLQRSLRTMEEIRSELDYLHQSIMIDLRSFAHEASSSVASCGYLLNALEALVREQPDLAARFRSRQNNYAARIGDCERLITHDPHRALEVSRLLLRDLHHELKAYSETVVKLSVAPVPA